MNKKISPTLIGAFVVGRRGLLVVAVIAFGSGRAVSGNQRIRALLRWHGERACTSARRSNSKVSKSARSKIFVATGRSQGVDKIPVIIEIDLEKLTSRGAAGRWRKQRSVSKEAIIKRGLRGQLQTESMVTACSECCFRFLCRTCPSPSCSSPTGHYKYPEIPTTPTSLERVQDAATQIITKIEEIDFKAMAYRSPRPLTA